MPHQNQHFDLSVALFYRLSFIPHNLIIFMLLVVESSFGADDIVLCQNWYFDQCPNFVAILLSLLPSIKVLRVLTQSLLVPG